MSNKIVVFWFRRDLRLNDNHGLQEALEAGLPVLPVFIFDTEILKKLPAKNDARVNFIHSEITRLKKETEAIGSSVKVFHSTPVDAMKELLAEFEVAAVYSNKDYEPDAIKRDEEIRKFLTEKEVEFRLFKDQVIFEENEVLKDNDEPYTVFTPYSKKWKQVLKDNPVLHFDSGENLEGLMKTKPFRLPGLKDIGFEESALEIPSREIPETIISNYDKTRDFPALEGTTRLGIHLRFGTISIRELTKKAGALSEVFLNELIWREFYMAILWHFPEVVNQSFKKKYDYINWRNSEKEFERWCNG